MREFRVLVNGNEYKVAIEELQQVSGSSLVRAAAPVQANPAPSKPQIKEAPQAASKQQPESNGEAAGIITAAMPGTILEVKAAVGDTVVRGQALLILEAMKMENEIMAPCDGVIGEIHATVGASVNSGDLLIVMS